MPAMEREEDERAAAAARQARTAVLAAKRQRQKLARQRAQAQQAQQAQQEEVQPPEARQSRSCSTDVGGSHADSGSTGSRSGCSSECSSDVEAVACLLQDLGLALGSTPPVCVLQPLPLLPEPAALAKQAGDAAAVEELLQLLGLGAHA